MYVDQTPAHKPHDKLHPIETPEEWWDTIKGHAEKNSATQCCFLHLRPQKASPLLPISGIITKLSKTLITLLHYILPQPL